MGHKISLVEWEEQQIGEVMGMDNEYLIDVISTVLSEYPPHEVLEVLGVQPNAIQGTLEDTEFARLGINSAKAKQVLEKVYLILGGNSKMSLPSASFGTTPVHPPKNLDYIPPVNVFHDQDTEKMATSTQVSNTPAILRSPSISKPSVADTVVSTLIRDDTRRFQTHLSELPNSARLASHMDVPYSHEDLTPHSAPIGSSMFANLGSVRKPYLFDDSATIRNETVRNSRIRIDDEFLLPPLNLTDPPVAKSVIEGTQISEFRQEFGRTNPDPEPSFPVRHSLPPVPPNHQKYQPPPEKKSMFDFFKPQRSGEQWKCGRFSIWLIVSIIVSIILLSVAIFLILFFTLPRSNAATTPTNESRPTGGIATRVVVSNFAGASGTTLADGEKSAAVFQTRFHTITPDSNQNLWFSDGALRTLHRNNNTVTSTFGGTDFEATAMIVRNGVLYFADKTASIIFQMPTVTTIPSAVRVNLFISGNQTEATATGTTFLGIIDIQGMAIRNDELFFTDAGQHVLFKVQLNGGVASIVAGTRNSRGSTNGQARSSSFDQPGGLTFDSDGNLYICDRGNHRIRRLSIDGGEVSDFVGSKAGEKDGNGVNAEFLEPHSVLFHEGWIYMTDRNTIRRISLQGDVETITKVNQPTGMVVQDNSLLVLERGSRRILKIDNIF
jgi:hypothetical protein